MGNMWVQYCNICHCASGYSYWTLVRISYLYIKEHMLKTVWIILKKIKLFYWPVYMVGQFSVNICIIGYPSQFTDLLHTRWMWAGVRFQIVINFSTLSINLMFLGPCIVIIFQYISNKMQCYTVYFIWKTAYMFRVVSPPIIRSANNCIYSIWYLSHS
jgi:hypothetical protein